MIDIVATGMTLAQQLAPFIQAEPPMSVGPFRFDPTINIATVLTFLTGLFVLFKAYQGIISRLDRLETRMEPLWKWFVDQLPDIKIAGVSIERKGK